MNDSANEYRDDAPIRTQTRTPPDGTTEETTDDDADTNAGEAPIATQTRVA